MNPACASRNCIQTTSPDALLTAARETQTDLTKQKEVQTRSQTIAEWYVEQGKTQGQLRARRDDLRGLLQKRFGAVPEALHQKIEQTTDLERLHAAVLQVLSISSAEELQL